MPKVSVVIPVYNAGHHLTQCIDSILSQTLRDIEVVCVDDGSTDESLAILRKRAAQDSRLTVISQENAGAGSARNLALEMVCGEYLCFLDADDFFEPTMLEETTAECDQDAADVCVCMARLYDTRTGHYRPAGWLLRTALIPQKRPFSFEDTPESILVFTSPAPWNKLFRRSFIINEGIRFQEIKRTNDLYFTRLAMMRAKRITVVEKELVNYRVGSASNLQATNHEAPLEFYEALSALRDELQRTGQFAAVERSFANDALSICLHNLNSLRDAEAYCSLYGSLRGGLFADLGVLGYERSDFFLGGQYDQLMKIMTMSPAAYLTDEANALRKTLATATGEFDEAVQDLRFRNEVLERLRTSWSYRIGRKVSKALRKVKPQTRANKKAV